MTAHRGGPDRPEPDPDLARLDALDPDLERNDLWSIAHRRLTGRFPIDEFGLDPDLLALSRPLSRLRWRVQVEGGEHLPEVGPALLVHNRRFGVSEPAVLGLALHQVTGRPQRWTGATGRGPLARTSRQLGGVPSDPADIRSLLHGGELVSLPLGRELVHPRRVPAVPVAPVAAALEVGAPIIAVGLQGSEVGWSWRARVGRPIQTRRRRTTADPAGLAEAARHALAELLDQRGRPPRDGSSVTGPVGAGH